MAPASASDFGDREAEAAVVGDPGDERALAGEVDVQHSSDIAIGGVIDKG